MLPNADTAGIFQKAGPSGQSGLGARIRLDPAAKSAATRAAEANPNSNSAYLTDAEAQPTIPAREHQGTYQSFADKDLWSPNGPRVDDFQQGDLGNCWLQSTLQNMVTRNMNVKGLIDDIPGRPGWYNVHLRNPKTNDPVDIAVDSFLPADVSGTPVFGGSKAKGIGGALIEKAVAKLYDYIGTSGKNEGYETLVAGGANKATATLLPNSRQAGLSFHLDESGGLYVADFNGSRPLEAVAAGQVKSRLETALQNATGKDAKGNFLSSDGIFCIGFGKDYPELKIYGEHQYSVLDYQPSTGTITLLEPNFGLDATPPLIKISFNDLLKMNAIIFT